MKPQQDQAFTVTVHENSTEVCDTRVVYARTAWEAIQAYRKTFNEHIPGCGALVDARPVEGGN